MEPVNNDRFTTNVSIGSTDKYSCEIIMGDLIGVDSKKVQIDLEPPLITGVTYNSDWEKLKDVTVNASDNFSGIDSYSIALVTDECSDYFKSKILKVLENGRYKVCVKDKAGNIAKTSEEIIIENIDGEPPEISANSAEVEVTIGDDYNILENYFTVKYGASGGSTACNYSNTGDLELGKYNVECVATGGNKLTAGASTILYVRPEGPSKPNVNARLSNADGNVYKSEYTNKNIYFEVSPGSELDIITHYEYKIENDIWSKPSDLSMNDYVGIFTYSKEVDSTIYIRACMDDVCSLAVDLPIKIDKTSPTCSLGISSYSVSFYSKSNDAKYYGINKSSVADYSNSSLSLSSATYYGHVKDKAGNTGRCSITVINASPIYNKVTTTCNQYVSSYNCVGNAAGFLVCESGYTLTNGYCTKTQSANKKVTYTKTSKSCLKQNQTWTKTASKCSSLSNKTACLNKMGCSWSNKKCSGYYCSTTGYSYVKSSGKCEMAGFTYAFGSTSTSKGLSSCSESTFSACNSYNVNKTYVTCSKSTSYSCPSGFDRDGSTCYQSYYPLTQYGCPVGQTLSGTKCYIYNQNYCGSGYSVYSYNYEYDTSSSTSTTTSCNVGSSFSCNSSHSGSSYVSSCSISAYSCPSGYTKVGTYYCYK